MAMLRLHLGTGLLCLSASSLLGSTDASPLVFVWLEPLQFGFLSLSTKRVRAKSLVLRQLPGWSKAQIAALGFLSPDLGRFSRWVAGRH